MMPDLGLELYLLFDSEFGESADYIDWSELSDTDKAKWQVIAAEFLKKVAA